MNLYKYLFSHLPLVTWEYEGYLSSTPSFYELQKDWNQTLMTKINQVSATILKHTMRGGANLILIPEHHVNLFKTLEYLKVNEIQHNGYSELGTLSGRFLVCVVPEINKIRVVTGREEPEYEEFDSHKIFICKTKKETQVLDPESYDCVSAINVT